ncbi:MAG: DciA family protein, partial [bacterium]|nr:DciA family protein [bacterium]
MAFSSLRNLLPGAARRSGITRDVAITQVLRIAQQELERIFGKDYSKFAEPVSVRKDGALVIACRSPVVAQTIRLHEMAVLTAVRTASTSITIGRVFLVPRSREDVF